VESPSQPGGVTSVASEPLDDYTDFYKLWCGSIKWLKKGRKGSRLEMEMPRFFLVVQLAPRSAFPSCPANVPTHEHSPNGSDCIAVAYMHHLDRQQRKLRIEAVANGFTLGREYYLFHEEPLCVEAWRETGGSRFAGEWWRTVMQGSLDAILDRAHPGKREKPCRIWPNIEDPPNSGLMQTLSDELDEYISFERIWVEWLDMLKYPNSKGGPIKDVKLTILSELEFSILQVVDGDKAYDVCGVENKPGRLVHDFRRVHYHQQARAFYIEHFLDGHEVPRRYWIRFWETPLRVCSWGETSGKRNASEEFAQQVERMVNSALQDEQAPEPASAP